MDTTKAFRILFIALMALTILAGCGDDDDDDNNSDDSGDDDDDDNDDNNDDDTGPIDPHREVYENFTVVWLTGSPYQMGVQHGELLHDELAAGVDWLNSMHLIDLLIPVAKALGLYDLAMSNSYPDLIEECNGLVDSAGDVGWSMELCMLLNFGDVLVEFLSTGFPPATALSPGCTELAARGDATVDGKLYHGRILDWDRIEYLIDYPVIFVRQPSDGIAHTFIGFPGNLSPYSGMNTAGVSVASNEATPLDNSQHDRTGRSHVQLVAQLLKHAHNLDEAKQMVLGLDHMTVELIMVTDGPNKEAAVFEMTSTAVGVRELEDDVLWATNHFVAPETADLDEDPAGSSSTLRYDRAQQLLAPDGQDTRYGEIDPEVMIEIMRDRINPYDGTQSPADTFDNNLGLAVNGAIYQIVFDPADLLFWVAAGAIPVPLQPFVGFSLGELLELPGSVPATPAIFDGVGNP